LTDADLVPNRLSGPHQDKQKQEKKKGIGQGKRDSELRTQVRGQQRDSLLDTQDATCALFVVWTKQNNPISSQYRSISGWDLALQPNFLQQDLSNSNC
jgi:hypothetical protein